MIKISFSLPLRRRLDLSFVRQRGAIDEPLLPSLTELRKTRSGNKISRYFRHVFEHKRISRVLGSNLALVAIAGSMVSGSQAAADQMSLKTNDEALVLSAPSPTNLTTEHGVIYPVEKVKINQGYRFFHPGIDLDGETGDAIYPVMGGKVEKIERSRFAYGNSILINHGNGVKSLYAHLSKITVAEGQEVNHKTKIGEVGSTGWSTGAHLHLEVYEAGRTINPLSVLPKH